MIVLDATSKSLEIVLAGAITTNQLPVVAAYVDINQNDKSVAAISNTSQNTNSTTPITIAAVPSSGYSRVIKTITIENKDTVVATFTLSMNVSGTLYTICKITLAVGDNFIYTADD